MRKSDFMNKGMGVAACDSFIAMDLNGNQDEKLEVQTHKYPAKYVPHFKTRRKLQPFFV
jgi:hypothetical protein